MPWVLWTSWGRYSMEGDQQRESGPANRLHVQVLDNSCFHRASLESTSVQGPERRLNMDAKSCFISQIYFLHKHPCIFLISVWWLLFGTEKSFTSPWLMEGVRETSYQVASMTGVLLRIQSTLWLKKKKKKKVLVMACKAFHLCNLISHPTLLRNSEHLWFFFMDVHVFYQVKGKSDPVMFPQRTTWLKICWTRTISHDVIAPDVS